MKKEKDPSKQVFESLVNMLQDIEGNYNDVFKEALITGETREAALLLHNTTHHFKLKHGDRLSESDLEKIRRLCVESHSQWAFVLQAEHNKNARRQANLNLPRNQWISRFQVDISKIPSDVRWVAEGQRHVADFEPRELFMKILKKNFDERLPGIQFNNNASSNLAQNSTTNPQSSTMPNTPVHSKPSTEDPAKTQQSAPPQLSTEGSESAPKPQWVESDKKYLKEAIGFLEATTKLMQKPEEKKASLTKVSKIIKEKLKTLEGKNDRNSTELKKVYEKTLKLIIAPSENPQKSPKR